MDTSMSLPIDVDPITNGPVRGIDVDSQQHEQIPISPEDRASISTACTACRDKHLKCDGARLCARCRSGGYYCQYIRSRRGYKSSRRYNTQAQCPGRALVVDTAMTSVSSDTNNFDDCSLKGSAYLNSSYTFTTDNQMQEPGYRQQLLEGFFHFFYQAHPSLAPREHTMRLLKSKPIPHLETAMCYIASQYVSTRLTATFSLELEALIASTDIPNDGFLVQALLLFVIGLDGNNEQLRALEVLTRARKFAIQLGMNQHEFAILNGGGLPVLEESWRRTWWELYTVDGIIAGLHQINTFQLFDVEANVSLPCEEETVSGLSVAKPPSRNLELL